MFSRRYSIVCICSRFECSCPQSQGIFYLYNTLYTGIRILSDCGGESILGGSQAAGDHKAHAQRLFHPGEQEEVHQHQWAGVLDAGWHFRCTNSDYTLQYRIQQQCEQECYPSGELTLGSAGLGLFCLNLFMKILGSKCPGVNRAISLDFGYIIGDESG